MDDFLGVTVHECIGQLKYVLQHRQTDRETCVELRQFMLCCIANLTLLVHHNTVTTTTKTILRPFVWDNPGEPVPEETLTHPPS